MPWQSTVHLHHSFHAPTIQILGRSSLILCSLQSCNHPTTLFHLLSHVGLPLLPRWHQQRREHKNPRMPSAPAFRYRNVLRAREWVHWRGGIDSVPRSIVDPVQGGGTSMEWQLIWLIVSRYESLFAVKSETINSRSSVHTTDVTLLFQPFVEWTAGSLHWLPLSVTQNRSDDWPDPTGSRMHSCVLFYVGCRAKTDSVWNHTTSAGEMGVLRTVLQSRRPRPSGGPVLV